MIEDIYKQIIKDILKNEKLSFKITDKKLYYYVKQIINLAWQYDQVKDIDTSTAKHIPYPF